MVTGGQKWSSSILFLHSEGWCRRTRHCCSSHMLSLICWLTSLVWDSSQALQPGLQLLHFPWDLPSASLIPGPEEYLTLWWRAPASSAGHPHYRSWRWWDTDRGSRPSSPVPALARARQSVLRLPHFTSIFPSRLPALQTSSSSIRCKDNSLRDCLISSHYCISSNPY